MLCLLSKQVFFAQAFPATVFMGHVLPKLCPARALQHLEAPFPHGFASQSAFPSAWEVSHFYPVGGKELGL